MHLPTTEYNRKTASCPISNQLCMVKKPFKLLLQQTNGVCCMVGYLLNLCSALVDRFYEDFCIPACANNELVIHSNERRRQYYLRKTFEAFISWTRFPRK